MQFAICKLLLQGAPSALVPWVWLTSVLQGTGRWKRWFSPVSSQLLLLEEGGTLVGNVTDFGDCHDIREWDVLLGYWSVFLLMRPSRRWEGVNHQAPKRAE